MTYLRLKKKKLKPHSVASVSVHLQIEIPPGYYGHVPSRSGLAGHYFIDVEGGVIESDFQGELIVVMFNHSEKLYEVKVVERVAQIVFHCREVLKFVVCDELSKIDRELGEFGSTGI